MAKYEGNFEGSSYWISDYKTIASNAAVCTVDIIYISRDLLKPAFMTFRTFYIKSFEKHQKLRNFTYLYIALKPI